MLLKKTANLGVDISHNNDEIKRIRIINNSSLIGIAVLSIHIIFNLIKGTYLVALGDFIASQVFLFILFLNWRRKYKTAQLVLFIIFPVGLLPFNLFLGNVGSENFLFTMIVLAFYVFSSPTKRFVFSVYYACTYVLIKLILYLGFSMDLYPTIRPYFYWYNTVISLCSITLISIVYTNENKAHLSLLKKQNNDLNHQNAFINELLKELNHRVKNNLQIISGLFNLQRHNTDNEELKDGLSDARNRIISISLLHKKLYLDNSNTTKVPIDEYLLDLCNFILQSSGLGENTEVEIATDNISLSIEDSVHVGLIVNEAVTNSIKHGFNNISTQKLKVGLRLGKGCACLKIRDNGRGFPDNFTQGNSRQFGIFLMKTIAENGDGKIDFYNDNGAVVDVKLAISQTDK